MVSGNQFLQEMWDVHRHPKLTVMNGKILFLGNPRLCHHKIAEFTASLELVNASVDSRNIVDNNKNDYFNGYYAICKFTGIVLCS